MKFLKAFNNSAALVEDDGTEKIVLGKGIGFGLKKGQDVDQSKIERCFVTTEQSDEVEQVKEFTAQTIDVTNQIVKLVEPFLQTKFSDYQYLALVDHIDIDPANNDWEAKNLFPKEYAISKK